jgi:hypothetical protein
VLAGICFIIIFLIFEKISTGASRRMKFKKTIIFAWELGGGALGLVNTTVIPAR